MTNSAHFIQMLNKDTEQQAEEIKRLKDKEERLIETIRSLEKDIQSHKKEIRSVGTVQARATSCILIM
jgi:hypothetical protein